MVSKNRLRKQLAKNQKAQSRSIVEPAGAGVVPPSGRHEDRLLNQKRREYARLWSHGDSLHFEAQGYYDWMADKVEPQGLILEIGCGDGRTTALLAKRGHAVVSLDFNPFCIELATKRLDELHVKFSANYRGRTVPFGPGYVLEYGPLDAVLPSPSEVVLIESDVRCDDALRLWCKANASFDSVLCWLIGTHQGQERDARLIGRVRNEQDARLSVQNRVYELADASLKTGGIIHVVDRGHVYVEPDLSTLKRAFAEGHAEQADSTSLITDSESIDLLPFTFPAGRATKVKLSGRSLESHQAGASPAFWSIVSRKPVA